LQKQQDAILQKRAAVHATLMAQRNQKLMNGAPDADVEALNNQISAVMSKIDAATTMVAANQQRVAAKRDLLARQLRKAEADLRTMQ
jgi:sulfur transfer complex TusBCD TusB component (DsrH family)